MGGVGPRVPLAFNEKRDFAAHKVYLGINA